VTSFEGLIGAPELRALRPAGDSAGDFRAAVRAVLGIETSGRKQKKSGYVMLAVSLGHA
jgi:hypothetical protein